MTRICEACRKTYDDARCTTLCPHSRFISEWTARRKDLAYSLVGKNLKFREKSVEIPAEFPPLHIQSIDGFGVVTLRELQGEYSPDCFEVIDSSRPHASGVDAD